MEHLVRDLLHRRAIRDVRRIEAQDDVIDGLLDFGALCCRRAHERRGQFWIVCGHIPRGAPGYSITLVASSTCREVRCKRAETLPAAGDGDHVEMAARQVNDLVQLTHDREDVVEC